jgi:adenylate kinase
MIIVITGTPGTGKSTLARALAKRFDLKRLDLHDHYKELSVGYNQSKKCYDIDMKKFEELVNSGKEKLIIDSHIAHLLPKKMVDLCIVLTCSNLKKLHGRLKGRKYSKKKIEENVQAEIFQVCLEEARAKKHKIVVFDAGELKRKELFKEASKVL